MECSEVAIVQVNFFFLGAKFKLNAFSSDICLSGSLWGCPMVEETRSTPSMARTPFLENIFLKKIVIFSFH